jgi:hypothetical protein
MHDGPFFPVRCFQCVDARVCGKNIVLDPEGHHPGIRNVNQGKTWPLAMTHLDSRTRTRNDSHQPTPPSLLTPTQAPAAHRRFLDLLIALRSTATCTCSSAPTRTCCTCCTLHPRALLHPRPAILILVLMRPRAGLTLRIRVVCRGSTGREERRDVDFVREGPVGEGGVEGGVDPECRVGRYGCLQVSFVCMYDQ